MVMEGQGLEKWHLTPLPMEASDLKAWERIKQSRPLSK
jgi:hypothetical protein